LKATLLNMRCRCRLPIVCLKHTHILTHRPRVGVADGWKAKSLADSYGPLKFICHFHTH